MSELLPLFPLPNVVLFPGVFLPLHVFEPRYRDMVAAALESDRLIGMVLLKPGWEPHYEKRPPVFPVGCSGVITHVERLTDGRYNIVLRGLERFRIVSEDQSRSFRRAAIDPLPEPHATPDDRTAVRRLRARLDGLIGPAIEMSSQEPSAAAHPAARGVDARATSAMNDGDLVNALSQYLALDPLEKQALLEQPGLRSRAAALVELLEMKIMIARTPGASNVAH